MTRKAANLRAIVIIGAAILAFLSQSPEFSKMAPDWLYMVVGAASVSACTYRAWLDQSSSKVDSEPVKEKEEPKS